MEKHDCRCGKEAEKLLQRLYNYKPPSAVFLKIIPLLFIFKCIFFSLSGKSFPLTSRLYAVKCVWLKKLNKKI